MSVNVSRDGNGGYDINIQRRTLKRWGPFFAALMVFAGGLGAKLGEQVWGIVLDREAINQRVTGNTSAVEKIQGDIEEIKDEQREITILLKTHIGKGDD